MNDKRIVEIQLNRRIDNFFETNKYCPFGYPAVITVNPFFKKVAAPTMYWLTCPYLIYRVDRLESESNLISKLGKKLEKDIEFNNLMNKSHQRYAEKRSNLITKKQLEKAKSISNDLFNTLLNSGVGGIKDKKGIKCLHTHLADYLVGETNPVGEIVFKKIDWPENCNQCRERIDQIESSSN